MRHQAYHGNRARIGSPKTVASSTAFLGNTRPMSAFPADQVTFIGVAEDEGHLGLVVTQTPAGGSRGPPGIVDVVCQESRRDA